MTNASLVPANSTVAIVLNWNRPEDTIACVQSLHRSEPPPDMVLVVDNGSTDNSVERIENALPGVPVVRLSENTGYAGGNNAGIRIALASSPEFILIVNNDIIVEPGFLGPLLEALRADSRAGIATPKILYHDRPHVIYAAGGHCSRWLCTGVADRQGKRDTSEPGEQSRPRSVTFASGSAFLVRSETLKQVGPLEEKFFMYFEDLEFSSRVRRRYSILYVPASRVYHKVGAGSSWAQYSPLYHYYYTRNRLWFFCRGSVVSRAYAACFCLFNVLAKSAAIVAAAWRPRFRALSVRDRLLALWKGYWDGILKGSEAARGA